MKRSVFVGTILCLLLMLTVVSSQDASGISPTTGDQYDEIQDTIDQIPLDNSGNLDEDKLNDSFVFFSSKADERIDAINEWMDTNIGWLYIVFQMRPEISLIFFLNVFFILLFFTHLVLNAYKFFPYFESSLSAYIMGICLFLLLLFTQVYRFLAIVIATVFDIFWNIVLPWGTFIAILLVALLAVVLFFFWWLAPEAFAILSRGIARLMGKKAASKAADIAITKAENKFNELNKRQEENLKKQDAFLQGADLD